MTFDIDEALANELQSALAVQNAIVTNVGIVTIKPAEQWSREAKQRPNPKELWLSLWYEGEVCCLFADSNLGKSIYAVQIANEIAKREKVIYFDFELSDKQFQLRYTDECGNLYKFPKNFLRAEINREATTDLGFEDAVIQSIEDSAITTGAKVLIIDNLTYLCIASEKGDTAGSLMMRLMQLKRKHNLSILILAHTPKRPLCNPITQNDLAGSKKLYNFFDSVFAIGRSAKDSNLRYIKQLKVRYGAYTYDADNIIVCAIEKENTFLKFEIVGYAQEAEHLKEQTAKDQSQERELIEQYRQEGKTVREIAKILGISKSKVGRVAK